MVTDLFSKWVETFPLKATDSGTLANVLVDDIVCRYGTQLAYIVIKGQIFTVRLLTDYVAYYS